MTTASIPTTKTWQCRAPVANGGICGAIFDDPSESQPCPRCGNNDDNTIEPYAPSGAAAVGTVKKVPPVGGKTATSKPPSNSGRMLGIGALAVGAPLWLEGARTTRDGWVLFLNWILERLGAPTAIPHSAAWPWWLAIGALVLLGVAYSHIEVKQTPLTIRPWRVNHTWQVWVTWIVFIVSDVGTMYLGARSPRAGDPALLHQIAGIALASGVYAILITFVPERLVMFGWRKLRG